MPNDKDVRDKERVGVAGMMGGPALKAITASQMTQRQIREARAQCAMKGGEWVNGECSIK